MKIDDICTDDLKSNPIWYFTSDDDETIRPLKDNSMLDDCQYIVRTDYVDTDGIEYIGYTTGSIDNDISAIQPVIFLETGISLYFYTGVFEPKDELIELLHSNISLPISYKSYQDEMLDPFNGVLEGIYYMDKTTKEIKVKG